MATPVLEPGAWSATPFPSSIRLYKPGHGWPDFDQRKAEAYHRQVVARVRDLVKDVLRRWDAAGLR